MTANTKWAAALSYANALTTELNSLADGSVAVANTAIDNSANLHQDGYVSFEFTGTTGTGSPFVSVYLLPLNKDGTTYGDGTASGATPPADSYLVGVARLNPSLSGTLVGTVKLPPESVPPTPFKLGVLNRTGNALGPTGNTAAFAPASTNLNG